MLRPCGFSVHSNGKTLCITKGFCAPFFSRIINPQLNSFCTQFLSNFYALFHTPFRSTLTDTVSFFYTPTTPLTTKTTT